MEEKGYCNLRMSTVSRFGQTRHMQFRDFLKYNEKKLVPGNPEVFFETHGKKIKFRNPRIMNLPNNHDTWEKYVPSYMNDFAVFVFGGERKPMIIDFHLSTYLRTLLQDDLQSGQNIHTFDLKFSNEYQAKTEFTVEGAGISIINDLDSVDATRRDTEELLDFLEGEWKILRKKLESSGVGSDDSTRRLAEKHMAIARENFEKDSFQASRNSMGSADEAMESLRRLV